LLLLASLALWVDESAGGGASCTLDEDACEADEDAVEAEAEVAEEDACCWLCAALFCWTMLCWRVCENGIAFAAAVAAALLD